MTREPPADGRSEEETGKHPVGVRLGAEEFREVWKGDRS